MWLAVCREYHVTVHPPTVVCSSRMRTGRGGKRGALGGERCDQHHRCLPHSFCREVLAQCWWTHAAASLQHWPCDISYQITLTAATSQWEKSSLAVVNGLIKNFWFYSLEGTDVADRDQIVAWRHDCQSLKWSHEHSPKPDLACFPLVLILH